MSCRRKHWRHIFKHSYGHGHTRFQRASACTYRLTNILIISSYEVILSHIGSPKRSRPPVIISFSSTNDLNALRLVDFAGDVVYQRFYLDDLQDTWECPSLFYASPAPLGLRKKPVERGASFSPGGVSKIMNKPHVIKQVVQEWQNRASTRKSTLVYCHDDTHVKKLAKAFRELGIDARHLTSEEITATEGELCIKYRGEIAAFRAGQFPMLLVAHDRFYDLPNTDCIVLAAPHVDRSKLALRLATGMKASPQTSKENCLVIDILDGNHQLSPAYSICSLFQLEPHEVDGKPPNVLQEIARKKAQLALDSIPPPSEVKGPKLNPVELLPIENDEVLLRQAEQEKTDVALGALHGSSTRRRWVLCAPGIYVHDGMDRGHAILRQVNIEGEPRYEVYWTNRRLMEGAPKEGGAEDVLKLSTPEDLETTLKMLKQVLPLRAPERPKYRKFKPSDEQLDALKSMWPQNLDPINRVLFDGKPMERDAFFDWLSVGDVSDAMARLRYGKGPDITPFSYSNLTAIVGRILANKPPGEENMKKKAKELARWELKKAKSERKAEIDELLRQRRLEAQPL
ncbi:hypothetical protein R3P38DRAFT_3067381 [Favolaschia claudopus]|uniref:Uncharacterized protein n=1 Tax=Favolaschia claudopus TaxID=2862362 RepID=A0AAW0A1Y0_9AGAR